jgi:glycosidase
MGVWERSQAGLVIAKGHPVIMKELKEALPDLADEDIAGSPYCIKDYHADPCFGGDKGLEKARKELDKRRMKLILDFVPNHVAPDHPWTASHPEYFILGSKKDLADMPDDWYKAGKNVMAKARDPYYPSWPDVLQLNVFDQELREEILKTLLYIASKCDGIRCDMAMLVMNDIFARTWIGKTGVKPEVDFWVKMIPAVKEKFPEFLFIAESYWDTEHALIEQGFDFCYDKKFYDIIKEGSEKSLNHLAGNLDILHKTIRFLENHDEPRAANIFNPERHKALAVASLTLPGARMLHDGQLEGRKVKVPVFLSRRQEEPGNAELNYFYRQLLRILHYEVIRCGNWSPCKLSGWTDNQTCRNLLAWEWIGKRDNLLVVVNLSEHPAQAYVKSDYSYLPMRTYQLFDVIHGVLYERDGDELALNGLFVGLQAWGTHTFLIEH